MFDTPEKIRAALAAGTITQQQANDYFMQLRLQSTSVTPYAPYNPQSLPTITQSQLNNVEPSGVKYPWDKPFEEDVNIPAFDEDAFISYMNQNYRQNNTNEGFVMPDSEEEVNALVRQGRLTVNEANEMKERVRTQGGFEYNPKKSLAETVFGTSGEGSKGGAGFPMLGNWGSDLSTELYSLGRSIGAEKGTKGRAITGIAAAGASIFDIGRNVASGIGFEKRNNYVNDWYDDQARRVRFRSDPQNNDMNTTGNLPFKFGGIFEDGGEMGQPMAEGQMQQPQQQEQAPNPMQQVGIMVAEMLQQGMAPQQVLESLVERGVPQQQAVQIIEQVMSEMQQMQPQQQQAQESEQDLPKMKSGGVFNHKVGDFVEFKIGGKLKKGRISKIENGKIYL